MLSYPGVANEGFVAKGWIVYCCSFPWPTPAGLGRLDPHPLEPGQHLS